MKRGLVLLGLLAVGMLLGCGGSGETLQVEPQGGSAATASSDDATLEIGPDSTPDEVVVGLIEAMKSGDKDAKEALLTTKAREETSKHNMPVHTVAMPNTQYQVAQPKYLERNPDGAHVSCTLTETFEDGTEEHSIVWVLRREPEIGWRIAGMAVELIPGTQPQFLNFEDPLDMQRKMDEAAAALASQENALAAQEGNGAAVQEGSTAAAAQAEIPAGQETAPVEEPAGTQATAPRIERRPLKKL